MRVGRRPRRPLAFSFAVMNRSMIKLAAVLVGVAMVGRHARAAAQPPGGAGASRLVLEPCTDVPGIEKARCGTYWVWENRALPAGRKIPLKVIVLPSRRPHPEPDPMLLVSPGGPGSTNSELGLVVAQSAWWRDDREVVLVDLRGTSGPNRLDCQMPGSDDDPGGYLTSLFPEPFIRECRDSLSRVADLTLYTSRLIVDDLDEVRAALGFDRVNLWGGSWGTRLALEYLRWRPQAVRSAILEGITPRSLKNPLSHARSAQNALDLLLSACLAQVRCHQAFPRARQELDDVIARLKAAPAEVSVSTPTGSVTVRLTWQQFAEALRVMTYSPPSSQQVPLVIHQAFLGDLNPFVSTGIASIKGFRRVLRLGFLLSITCTEDVPRIRPEEIDRETAGTYLGDSRVRDQIRACESWPQGEASDEQGDPVRSPVPVFLLSGTVDPVSPPRFGADAARYLPNGIHVVAPGGHVPAGPCVVAMERAFLASASAASVDTSCVRSMQLPAFGISESAGNR